MDIQTIIQITENKLSSLNSELSSAISAGNLEEVNRLESEVAETTITVNKLRSL